MEGALRVGIREYNVGVDCDCARVTGALEMPPVVIVEEGEMDVADGDGKTAPTISVVVWRETGIEEIGRVVDCGCARVTGALEMPPVIIVEKNIKGKMDVTDGDGKAPSAISVVVVWREG